jgi:hypothetical protein
MATMLSYRYVIGPGTRAKILGSVPIHFAEDYRVEGDGALLGKSIQILGLSAATELSEGGLSQILPAKLVKIGTLGAKWVGHVLDITCESGSAVCFRNGAMWIPSLTGKRGSHALRGVKKLLETLAGETKLRQEAFQYTHSASLEIASFDMFRGLYLHYSYQTSPNVAGVDFYVEDMDMPTSLYLVASGTDMAWTDHLEFSAPFTTVPVLRATAEPKSKNCLICDNDTVTKPNSIPICGKKCLKHFRTNNDIISYFEGKRNYLTCRHCSAMFQRDRRFQLEQFCSFTCSTAWGTNSTNLDQYR